MSSPINILAIDTSSQALSVALAASAGVWHTEIDTGPGAGGSHSELLMECADGLCRLAGLEPRHISLVACMKGPGSFTGLRIGFSAAKGLALALGIPLAAVPTLDCLAYPYAAWPGLVLPAIDAKQSRFYAALYRGGKRLTDYLDASPETLVNEASRVRNSPDEPLFLTGSGAELLRSRLAAASADNIRLENVTIDPDFRRGRAKDLLSMVKSGVFNGNDDIDSGPVYLRKSDAEQNRAKGNADEDLSLKRIHEWHE